MTATLERQDTIELKQPFADRVWNLLAEHMDAFGVTEKTLRAAQNVKVKLPVDQTDSTTQEAPVLVFTNHPDETSTFTLERGGNRQVSLDSEEDLLFIESALQTAMDYSMDFKQNSYMNGTQK